MKKFLSFLLVGVVMLFFICGCENHMKFDSENDMVEVVEGTWENSTGYNVLIIKDNYVYHYVDYGDKLLEEQQVEYNYKKGKIDGGEYWEYYVIDEKTIKHTSNTLYTKVSNSTSFDKQESSSMTDNTSSIVEVSIPDAYFGLIDENEKPYGEGKIFGWDETRTFKLTCSDNEGLNGKIQYYVNGEESNSFDWEYVGKGIYVEDHVQPYKYFLHQGYFVRMGDVGALLSSKLSGSSDTGYEYDDGFYRFYKNGKYDYGKKELRMHWRFFCSKHSNMVLIIGTIVVFFCDILC